MTDTNSAVQTVEDAFAKYRSYTEDVLRWAEVGRWELNFAEGTFDIGAEFIEKYGYSYEQLQPISIEKWTSLIHPDDVPDVMQNFAAMMSGQSDTLDTIYRMRKPDGGWRSFRTKGGIYSYTADHKPIRISGILQDITDSQKQEQELIDAKNRAEYATKTKSEFLARMSHEIRTPMNAICGMVYLCLQTELTDKQKDYLAKTQTAANNLLGIINDILDFSKIEANKIELENIPFSVRDVIAEVFDITAVTAAERGLVQDAVLAPNIGEHLLGDPLRLRQVLLNLLSNAVKFTDKGGITLTVEPADTDEYGKVILRFTVKDTGIGLSEEQVDRIFDSFSQADVSMTRKYGGTGLGLAIVKKLVALMGGEITVKSILGEGTAFTFTVVFSKTEQRPEDASGILLNKRRILVVDDDPNACEIVAGLLHSWKMLADTALSGLEALNKLTAAAKRNDPYDLVLLDWRMPRMDGIETIREIHKHTDISPPPHILMISAYDRNDCLRQTAGMNVAGVLLKPAEPAMLKKALKHAFMQQRDIKIEEIKTDLRGKKVLLAEDNKINQMVAKELLTLLGIETTVANNGREAVDLVKREHFDLILMDVQMPEIDGLEAAKQIRALAGKGFPSSSNSRIPILAMTANAMDTDYHKSLEAGMNDHLTKPINPAKLRLALEKWIER
ncbi:MAG: response regulator [Planctomycetaceae bacterium]|jgi:signal transduction histidine kinase/DNA-binding response OmpR family regulator|nr:response regulator [Planctomycetaceae bacterium]